MPHASVRPPTTSGWSGALPPWAICSRFPKFAPVIPMTYVRRVVAVK